MLYCFIDALAHPNVIGFVSHCGIGSVMESIFHGVPIVAIAIFMDQIDNAAFIVDKGLGVSIDKKKLTEEIVFDKITKLVTNTR